MNRRQFLETVAGVTAGAAVVPLLLSASSKEEPIVWVNHWPLDDIRVLTSSRDRQAYWFSYTREFFMDVVTCYGVNLIDLFARFLGHEPAKVLKVRHVEPHQRFILKDRSWGKQVVMTFNKWAGLVSPSFPPTMDDPADYHATVSVYPRAFEHLIDHRIHPGYESFWPRAFTRITKGYEFPMLVERLPWPTCPFPNVVTAMSKYEWSGTQRHPKPGVKVIL